MTTPDRSGGRRRPAHRADAGAAAELVPPRPAAAALRRPASSALGVLGALGGAFIASETQARLSPWVTGAGLVVGSALGALMGKNATKMMPLLGVVIGPFVAIALMNVQRFNASNLTTLAPVRRGPSTSTDVGFPMSSVALGVGALGSAVVAAVLLTALSRRLMGRRPLRRSMIGVGCIGFWVTVLMIGSYFAPV